MPNLIHGLSQINADAFRLDAVIRSRASGGEPMAFMVLRS